MCPFVPVANVTMEECAKLSQQLGHRLAMEMSVPVYLYECAVAGGDHHDYRRTLPQIREGEYEGLENKVRGKQAPFLNGIRIPPSLPLPPPPSPSVPLPPFPSLSLPSSLPPPSLPPSLSQLQDPKWAPDYGPTEFIPSWGATVTGARSFLIAYNINLLSTKEQAHRIALNIREQGRPNQVLEWSEC